MKQKIIVGIHPSKLFVIQSLGHLALALAPTNPKGAKRALKRLDRLVAAKECSAEVAKDFRDRTLAITPPHGPIYTRLRSGMRKIFLKSKHKKSKWLKSRLGLASLRQYASLLVRL